MRVALLFLIVLAIGCKANQSADACDLDFNNFFERFASDSLFQKKHIDFPIMHYYSDEDFPLDLMETMIDEQDYTFTDFTDDQNQYDISIEKKKDSAIYTRKTRDRHHLPMIYKFVQVNDCWKLVEISDLTD